MRDELPLRGQVAIVTGAAQGIERSIAVVLADAGARVAIGDLKDATGTIREIEAGGGTAAAMVMDVSRPDEADGLVEFAVRQYGGLDILVNNAGIDAPRGNAWDLPDGQWQRTIDVNLSGVFYCSRGSLRPMLAAGRGAIVNLSFQVARVGRPGLSPAYNATKAGIIDLPSAHARRAEACADQADGDHRAE